MTDSIIKNLEAARALIEKPENWVQHVFAARGDGGPVRLYENGNYWLARDAEKFCLRGAILRATDFRLPPVDDQNRQKSCFEFLWQNRGVEEERYVKDVIPHIYEIANFNNNHTHEQVLGVLDAAIAKRRQELEVSHV